MLNLREVERNFNFLFYGMCPQGPAEEKFDSRTFPACFQKIPRTKMAAGCVNCEAAFLNFYAEFERNR